MHTGPRPYANETLYLHEVGQVDEDGGSGVKATVAVAVCTRDRNQSLDRLLRAVLVNAERLGNRAAVGAVVVDDSHDGTARSVVDRFEGRFELGVHYLASGHHNISVARNLAIDRAARVADWVAMTDDDCEPQPDWLEMMLEMQRRTNAEAIRGFYLRQAPPGAPAWLTEEPFLEIATDDWVDGAQIDLAGTNNSMISSRWWEAHPEARFAEGLGITGGEDVVFFRTASAAGLKIHYARRAVVYEKEPLSRTSFAYQTWRFLWLGNSSYVTRRETGYDTPFRMLLQGFNQVRKAVTRPLARMVRGQRPQLRYSLAIAVFGVGILIGSLGVRVSHH